MASAPGPELWFQRALWYLATCTNTKMRNQVKYQLDFGFLVGVMKILWYNPFKLPPAPPAFGTGKVHPEASSS